MTFEEIIKENNVLAEIVKEINLIIQNAENYKIDFTDKKNDGNSKNITENQYAESMVERVLFNDRRHPVDTVIINSFNRKTDSELGKVEMIYGPAADEFTRSQHALAITIANSIYFRNGAYKPETEEGRKLLAHELTHIAQNKNKEDKRVKSENELEAEAEKNELTMQYNPDPLIKKKIGNKEYSLRKSEWKRIYENAIEIVETRIEDKEKDLDEQEFLNLLLKYEDWKKEKREIWQL